MSDPFSPDTLAPGVTDKDTEAGRETDDPDDAEYYCPNPDCLDARFICRPAYGECPLCGGDVELL